MTFYKVVHGLVAIPSENILVTAYSRTRSSHDNDLTYKHIQANTQAYKNSFYVRTIKDWNSLPEDAVKAPSVHAFKQSLKSPSQ